MEKQKFNPTAYQIIVAQELFATMALRSIAKESFDSFEKQLIDTGQYHYASKYYDTKRLVRLNFPEDRIIRDPVDVCLMDGLEKLHTDQYSGTDSEKYFNELDRLSKEAGWIHGQNGFCIIDNKVNELERKLIIATESIHHCIVDDVSGSLEHWRRLVELLLKLFASIVKNDNLATVQKMVYGEHVSDRQAANVIYRKALDEFLTSDPVYPIPKG